MRRPAALRLHAALATLALAAATGAVLSAPEASAATGGATGYATQNGGTTGGAGGQTVRATTGTAIHQALCSRASSSTPITIQVEGTINHGNTSKVSGGSCSTADGVIELKQISNVTIVGVGSGAVFDQLGIHIRESRNIIIQNVTVRNVKKSGSPTSNGGDAIGMESGVRNVWVDHVTLEASGGESEGFDGLFDMKDNTQYVTLSYSVLRNSGRGGLIGSSETDTSNGYVTFHHNLYENIDSRAPLLRGGIAHIYNNHYVRLNESGINSRAWRRRQGGQQLLRGLQGRPGHVLHRRGRLLAGRGQRLRQRDLVQPQRRPQPGRAQPAVQHHCQHSVLLQSGRRRLRAGVVSQTAGANKGLRVSQATAHRRRPPPRPRRPTRPRPRPRRRPPRRRPSPPGPT
ncbi:Ribosomal protein L18 OS=Streptomyces glaucescens OX=1907 GN=SGLAU_30580 PE=3 SV=1 [Streptomyces glaucescens]